MAAKSHSAWAVVALCLAIIGLEGYDIQAFGVAAPAMMKELGLNATAQGIIGSAAMGGLVLGALLGGIASPRLGARRVLLVATILFGISSIATAFTSNLPALVLVRFFAGIGFGSALPVCISTASDASAPRWRTMTVTLAFCGLPAGAALVAIYSSFLEGLLSWRAIFITGGVLPIFLSLFINGVIPNAEAGAKSASGNFVRDLLGQGRAASSLLIWLTFSTTLMIIYLMLNWLPTLIIAMGADAEQGSFAAFIFNLASIAGAIVLALLVDRLGFRWPLCVAYVALAVVIACFSLTREVNDLLFLSGLAGFLIVGPQCALYAVIPKIYEPHARVLGTGACVAAGRVGAILGPLLAGELRSAGYSGAQVFLFLAPVPLIAAAAIFLLGSTASIRR